MGNSASSSSRLRERFELLRMRGAAHRLELALARHDLLEQSERLRHGASVLVAIVRALSPRNARSTGILATCLRYSAWIIPIASSLLSKSQSPRRAHWLRTALAATTLSMMVVRFLRGARRPRERGLQ